MVNTPIPHSLKSEAKKAAKILRDFTVPSAKAGPDKLIPAGLVIKAKGLAIITVVKAGFLITARGGSGIVIAQLDDGKWSAPSAIGIAGLGGGFEIGAEVTDFVIILNKSAAVEAFSKGGNLTLGGNFSIAAGPIGRSVEADVALRSTAAIYTYSKTKGLFAGISVEGSGLIERKDANRKFYKDENIRAFDILSGTVDPPPECQELYDVLANHKNAFEKAAISFAKREARKQGEKQLEKKAPGALSVIRGFSFRGSKKETSPSPSKSSRRGSGSSTSSHSPPSNRNSPVKVRRSEVKSSVVRRSEVSKTSKTVIHKSSGAIKKTVSSSSLKSNYTGSVDSGSSIGATASAWENESEWERPLVVRALFNFDGEMPCDLDFKEGDEITVLTRMDSQDDWWEGQVHGKTGIFPANYVNIL